MIRVTRAGPALVLLLLVTIGGTGCAQDNPIPAPKSTPTSTPKETHSASPPVATTTAPAVTDDEATPDPAAADDAKRAALEAVTAYCRPALDKAEWIAGLSPLLTDRGYTAYQTVDPAAVPCTEITGEAAVRDGDDAYTFRINVPTDAGTYEVFVIRSRTAEPWRVERMAPPE